MSRLLLQPDLSGNGPVHDVTPASAGWSHVSFGLHDLAAGGSVGSDGTADEICLVLLSGSARIIAGNLDTGMLQGRASVFDKDSVTNIHVLIFDYFVLNKTTYNTTYNTKGNGASIELYRYIVHPPSYYPYR